MTGHNCAPRSDRAQLRALPSSIVVASEATQSRAVAIGMRLPRRFAPRNDRAQLRALPSSIVVASVATQSRAVAIGMRLPRRLRASQ